MHALPCSLHNASLRPNTFWAFHVTWLHCLLPVFPPVRGVHSSPLYTFSEFLGCVSLEILLVCASFLLRGFTVNGKSVGICHSTLNTYNGFEPFWTSHSETTERKKTLLRLLSLEALSKLSHCFKLKRIRFTILQIAMNWRAFRRKNTSADKSELSLTASKHLRNRGYIVGVARCRFAFRR